MRRGNGTAIGEYRSDGGVKRRKDGANVGDESRNRKGRYERVLG